jgi:hypothetical protein
MFTLDRTLRKSEIFENLRKSYTIHAIIFYIQNQ